MGMVGIRLTDGRLGITAVDAAHRSLPAERPAVNVLSALQTDLLLALLFS
jgi:hypothetical protein